MYFLEKLKQELSESVNKALGQKLAVPADFEYPPEDASEADLALPCFKLAGVLKKNPNEIAMKAAGAKNKWLLKAETKGAYVNFYLKRDLVAKEILDVKSPAFNIGKGEKVMLEYVSPNSNKPLHLGHVRNGFLGEALSNILEFTGYKVKRSCLVNNRGVAISKAMLAYKLWGKKDSPKKSGLKPDHFVGKYYVLFESHFAKASRDKEKAAEELKSKVQELVQKWEAGDKETVALWKKVVKWAMDGYAETYKKLGIAFDKVYYEHELYKEGQKMAEKYLDKKVFVSDEKENIIAKLEECKLPDKVLLRGDGTAVYATTDIALAKKRIKEGFKKIFYVVGSEQDLYFKQLFCILKKMKLGSPSTSSGNNNPLDLRHLSYGMVELPEGKMKSREGTVVDADDLLANLESMALEEIRERKTLASHDEMERRKKIIALAAIKFYILNVNPPTIIHFNPKESLSFTGKTGPYLLYSYARLHSIWRKGKMKDASKLDFSLIKEKELWQLIWAMGKFPEVILEAGELLNPEKVASFLYEFAGKINEFYHKVPVLEAGLPARKVRIAAIGAALDALKKGFLLLGIEPLEEM